MSFRPFMVARFNGAATARSRMATGSGRSCPGYPGFNGAATARSRMAAWGWQYRSEAQALQWGRDR